MLRIERIVLAPWPNLPVTNIRLEWHGQIVHVSDCRNVRRQTCVRNSQQRSSILSGAKDRVRQVLPHHCGWSKVTIVGDIDQQVGAVGGDPACVARLG